MNKNNPKCHVPLCLQTPNCSFHRLPANTNKRRTVREKWIEAMDIDPEILGDGIISVCSRHFTHDDFEIGGTGSKHKIVFFISVEVINFFL